MRRQGICVEFCIICGEQGEDFLKSPVKKKQALKMSDALEIYDNFLTNYRKLVDSGIPVKVAIPLETSAMQLFRKRAAWHASCKQQFIDCHVEQTIQAYRELPKEQRPSIPVPKPVVRKEPAKRQKTIISYELRSISINRKLRKTDRSLCLLCQRQPIQRSKRRLPKITTEATFDLLLNRAAEMKLSYLVARLSACDWRDGYRYHTRCCMRLQKEYQKLKGIAVGVEDSSDEEEEEDELEEDE